MTGAALERKDRDTNADTSAVPRLALTVSEAAASCGLAESTLRDAVKRGEVAVVAHRGRERAGGTRLGQCSAPPPTLTAAPMALSHVLGRPESDMLEALETEFRAEVAAGRDFDTALNRAKRRSVELRK